MVMVMVRVQIMAKGILRAHGHGHRPTNPTVMVMWQLSHHSEHGDLMTIRANMKIVKNKNIKFDLFFKKR